MSTYHKIMEIFWLAVAIVSGMYAFYSLGKIGLEKTGVIIALPFVALILFIMRYFTRKRLEKKYGKDNE